MRNRIQTNEEDTMIGNEPKEGGCRFEEGSKKMGSLLGCKARLFGQWKVHCEGGLPKYAKLGYIENINLVCLDGNDKTLQPNNGKIVIFKSFFELAFVS
jgi:Rps23 Pro-64 3,4-dihydroxylase Tpa1-like proline 4-hydroxylase